MGEPLGSSLVTYHDHMHTHTNPRVESTMDPFLLQELPGEWGDITAPGIGGGEQHLPSGTARDGV